MKPKDIVSLLVQYNTIEFVNYPYQTMIAKELLAKYNEADIKTALEMYRGQVYSLAFFSPKIMGKAISRNSGRTNIQYEVGGDIAKRNKSKLQGSTHNPWLGERFDFDMLKE